MAQQRIRSTVHTAALGAAALIASQVAGKATRDALFLSHFAVTSLPVVTVASSLLSIAFGVITARLLSTLPASRLLPRGFMIGAVLLLLEWWISSGNPGLSAILLYVQMAVLSSALISGFWSLLDDRFDARSAKKQFGKVVAASTVGGVLGGLLAARLTSNIGVVNMLPVLASFHLGCSFISAALAPANTPHRKNPNEHPTRHSASGFSILVSVSYVRNLALLLFVSTIGAGLLDYVFKARVSASFSSGEELARFFAFFYATTGVVTLVVQLALSRAAVEKIGIAGTVGTLPATLTAGGLAGLIVPGLYTVFAARCAEAAFRSSLFKSGYEMLFAAIPRRQRRATKSIIDVGVDRLGDVVGGVLIGGILLSMSGDSTSTMLICAVALGLVAFWISRRLRSGYVEALENSLLSQVMSGPVSKFLNSGRSVVKTFGTFAFGKGQSKAASSAVHDPVLEQIADLSSPDVNVVRQSLRQPLRIDVVSYVIALLARDGVSSEAVDALTRFGPRITGQLVDALLDSERASSIRRRVSRVLAEFDSERAIAGLIDGLSADSFEIRSHSAEALTQIQSRHPEIVMNRDAIISAVEREIENDREVDTATTIAHIFRLLTLVHAREPLQIAHRALRSSDDRLKGTSLEYLENVLPARVWQRILPLLEDAGRI